MDKAFCLPVELGQHACILLIAIFVFEGFYNTAQELLSTLFWLIMQSFEHYNKRAGTMA